MKRIVRLTESDIYDIVGESVRRTILETIRERKMRLNECGKPYSSGCGYGSTTSGSYGGCGGGSHSGCGGSSSGYSGCGGSGGGSRC